MFVIMPFMMGITFMGNICASVSHFLVALSKYPEEKNRKPLIESFNNINKQINITLNVHLS